MSGPSTADLLMEAWAVIDDDATCAKEGCDLQGRDWACPGCSPETCGGRREHARLLDLAGRIKARATQLRTAPDPLGEALNSGDGVYRP